MRVNLLLINMAVQNHTDINTGTWINQVSLHKQNLHKGKISTNFAHLPNQNTNNLKNIFIYPIDRCNNYKIIKVKQTLSRLHILSQATMLMQEIIPERSLSGCQQYYLITYSISCTRATCNKPLMWFVARLFLSSWPNGNNAENYGSNYKTMWYSTVNYDYCIGNQQLDNTDMEKDLGIVITSDLKVSQQCSQVYAKANKILGMINRNITYKSREVLLRLYKSL